MPGVAVVAHYHNHYDDKWSEGRRPRPRTPARARHRPPVACSESVRDTSSTGSAGAARVTVLRTASTPHGSRTGTAPRPAALGIPPGTTVLGAVGRICAQKAPDDVLAAARRCCATGPAGRPAELWFVGAPDDAALAAAWPPGRRARGRERVRFLGYRADVPTSTRRSTSSSSPPAGRASGSSSPRRWPPAGPSSRPTSAASARPRAPGCRAARGAARAARRRRGAAGRGRRRARPAGAGRRPRAARGRPLRDARLGRGRGRPRRALPGRAVRHVPAAEPLPVGAP